jgi:hypothetical protein
VAQVIDRAFHLIEDWSSANVIIQAQPPPRAPLLGLSRDNHDMASSSSSDTTCKRPQQRRLKCNIDASFSGSLNRTGVGMCIRDSEGTFVVTPRFLKTEKGYYYFFL